VAERTRYQKRLQLWRDEFGRVGNPPPAPTVPPYLLVYFELQRWPGHLLCDGGLMDQPDWTWELVDLAGHTYESAVERNERRIKAMLEAKP
jgi:hypothetical protein